MDNELRFFEDDDQIIITQRDKISTDSIALDRKQAKLAVKRIELWLEDEANV